MMAAGTRAPIPMAAKATPANQDGKLCKKSAGTAKLFLYCRNPSANSGNLSTPLEEIFLSDDGCPIECSPMAQPTPADINRAVDRDAVPGQRTGRGDKIPKAATR